MNHQGGAMNSQDTSQSDAARRFNKLYAFLEGYNSDSRSERLAKVFIPIWTVFMLAFLDGFASATPSDYEGNLAVALASGLEHTTIEILLNNLFVGMLLATVGALIIPLLAILIGNGFMIGDAIAVLSFEYGPTAFLLVTPHGLFEIPAAMLAAMAGGRLSIFYFTYYITRQTPNKIVDTVENRKIYAETRRKTIQDYILLVTSSFILFVIAAIIETTLTIEFIYYFT